MIAFGAGGAVSDFITDAFSAIFISMIDHAVYTLLAFCYEVWTYLSKIDLFGAGSAGRIIYDNFTKTIYSMLAIVMVFIFSYRLLMRIMDPDGSYSPQTSPSKFIKGIIFSIVLVIVAPLIFKYMSMFQFHVVDENTIPAMILGENGGNDIINGGKQLSMITLMSFYHPQNMTYADFVVLNEEDANGNLVRKEVSSCDDIIDTHSGDQGVVAEWGEAMMDWCKSDDLTPHKILWNKDLRKSIPDEGGAEYYWVVCTAAGCLVIYFLVCYCIAVGTRAVRLGFLEIIAPIPIMLRMFGRDKFFKPWFDEIKKTYLELFIRIAIIAFVIYLCTLIPTFIDVIIQAI